MLYLAPLLGLSVVLQSCATVELLGESDIGLLSLGGSPAAAQSISFTETFAPVPVSIGGGWSIKDALLEEIGHRRGRNYFQSNRSPFYSGADCWDLDISIDAKFSNLAAGLVAFASLSTLAYRSGVVRYSVTGSLPGASGRIEPYSREYKVTYRDLFRRYSVQTGIGLDARSRIGLSRRILGDIAASTRAQAIEGGATGSIALLFANATYSEESGLAHLPSTLRSCDAVASVLERGFGFSAMRLVDVDGKRMFAEIRAAASRCNPDGRLVIWFSGHGRSNRSGTRVYLGDSKSKSPEAGKEMDWIDAQLILDALQDAPCDALVVLDACRTTAPTAWSVDRSPNSIFADSSIWVISASSREVDGGQIGRSSPLAECFQTVLSLAHENSEPVTGAALFGAIQALGGTYAESGFFQIGTASERSFALLPLNAESPSTDEGAREDPAVQ